MKYYVVAVYDTYLCKLSQHEVEAEDEDMALNNAFSNPNSKLWLPDWVNNTSRYVTNVIHI